VSGTTLFVITHRPSILAEVDKLMVLRDGALVIFGPRVQVLLELQKAQQAAAASQLAVSHV
jgi:ATP-binding cassette subfamily C protein EexD